MDASNGGWAEMKKSGMKGPTQRLYDKPAPIYNSVFFAGCGGVPSVLVRVLGQRQTQHTAYLVALIRGPGGGYGGGLDLEEGNSSTVRRRRGWMIRSWPLSTRKIRPVTCPLPVSAL